MIWIRADGNSEIGTGHIMRCLSIAAALQSLGEEVCFILADENPVPLLEKRKQPFLVLHTDYRNMEGEQEVLSELLLAKQPALFLIDSYFVTDNYLKKAGQYVRTAYMDDNCLAPYPVDVLINYNIYGEAQRYHYDDGSRPQFLLGTAYAPLRKEFQGIQYQIRDTAGNVLITTGGSDKYNLAGRILQRALEDGLTDFAFHVVSGVFNRNLSFLQKLAREHSNVHIHQNVTDMSRLMRQCDIAVTAGGSTMYELCAVGVPLICFSFVDNQEEIVETFREKGLVCYGGNYLREGEKLVEDVVSHIAELAENYDARLVYSKRERTLVDGKGALRLAKILCSTGKESCGTGEGM